MTRDDTASKLFAVDGARREAEAELEAGLDVIYGADGWEDYTYDWYDTSLEVYEVSREAPWDELRHLGFSRVWQHRHPKSQRWSGDPPVSCPCRAVRGSP